MNLRLNLLLVFPTGDDTSVSSMSSSRRTSEQGSIGVSSPSLGENIARRALHRLGASSESSIAKR